MSDKDKSGEEKDYWGGLYTQKSDRIADKTGWGEWKEIVLPQTQNWNNGGTTGVSPKVDGALGWSSGAPAGREVVCDVATEPARHETPGAESELSSPHTARPTIVSYLMVAAAVVGGIVLMLMIVANTGRRSGEVSSSATNASAISTASSAFVNTKELNVRVGPGSEYSVVTKLAHGDGLTRIGTGQSADGGQWARIRFGSTEGWVNQKLISDNKPPPLVEEVPEGRDVTGNGFGDIVVSMGSVDGIQVVGMRVPQAARALGMRLIQQGEESEGGCFYVEPEGSDRGLSFMVNDGTIARVDVDGNKVQYEGGIRIGDMEAKLRFVFGNRLEVEPHTYDEQGKYFKLTHGKFGVVFETDGKRVTSIRSGRSPEFEYIEGCS